MEILTTHRKDSGRVIVFRTLCSIAVGILLVANPARGQEPGPIEASPSVIGQRMAEEARPATPLRELVEEVEESNPQLSGAYHAWMAATHVGGQAGSFPDTQIFVQHFGVGSPRPFAGYSNSDFAYIGVGASQDIPFPGKRGLRRAVADREADSVHEQIDVVRRQVIEQLKLAYLQLAYIQQTLGFLHESDQLLDQIQQATASQYRTGHGNQQDVLKAQLQRTKNLMEITHHHQEEGQLEAQLKQILNRTQTSPDITAETLTLNPLQNTDEELLQHTGDDSPEVRTHSKMLLQQGAQIELAYREFLPDFNIQYTYEHTASKFRDYYMATFGIKFPNRDRQFAALAQAYQNQDRAKYELQAEEQRVLSEIKQQTVFVRASEERLKIYSEGLIPQSDATFQSGMAGYQSGRLDFAGLLSSFLDVLNANSEYRRELMEHESALVRLERLTGVNLR